jgi:hypothetical protein
MGIYAHSLMRFPLLALRIAAELITPTPQQECAADINREGQVRANDAIIILRKAAGLEG